MAIEEQIAELQKRIARLETAKVCDFCQGSRHRRVDDGDGHWDELPCKRCAGIGIVYDYEVI